MLLLCALAALCPAGGVRPVLAQQDTPSIQTEAKLYELKAAFLYNFAKFVSWPQDAFEDDAAPLTLCVLGSPAARRAVGGLEGSLVRGRSLALVGCDPGGTEAPAPRRPPHILFVAKGEDHASILAHYTDKPVLTVGEAASFATAGGIINFYEAANRLRFEVNLKAAHGAGISLSSQLLKLARIVDDNGASVPGLGLASRESVLSSGEAERGP